ncbi:MAG: Hpt domain-containing protein [Chlamydiota bacterium]
MTKASAVFQDFVGEAKEYLEAMQKNLDGVLKAEQSSQNLFFNDISHDLHSIKGGAGFLELENIKKLSVAMAKAVNGYRNGSMAIAAEGVEVLKEALLNLNKLVDDVENSDNEDISQTLEALENLAASSALPKDDKSIHTQNGSSANLIAFFWASVDQQRYALPVADFDKAIICDQDSLAIEDQVRFCYQGSFFPVVTLDQGFSNKREYKYIMLYKGRALLVEDIHDIVRCHGYEEKVEDSTAPWIDGHADLEGLSTYFVDPYKLSPIS